MDQSAGEGPHEITFEQALAELDAVVARLEEGSVGLEEAVALFERGREHLAICRRRLAASTRRIEELMADEAEGAEPQERPL